MHTCIVSAVSFQFLSQLVTTEERAGILKVLGQVHIADDSSDEDLKVKEHLKVNTLTLQYNYSNRYR